MMGNGQSDTMPWNWECDMGMEAFAMPSLDLSNRLLREDFRPRSTGPLGVITGKSIRL